MNEREKDTPASATAPVADDVSLDDVAPDRHGRTRASNEEWDAFTERVREASLLEHVVGADAALHGHGDELLCCSPLRSDDNTPSFGLSRKKQLWIDRGTGKGGDVFAYVMHRHGLGFVEARRWLAERAGIPQPTGLALTPAEQALADERHRIEQILTDAAETYHEALDDDRRAFLRSHYGFTDETINGEKLGYDPGGTYLWRALKAKGYQDEHLFQTGLFIERAPTLGTTYFHHRLTFPYWRHTHTVYFAARATKETPKIPVRGRDGAITKNADGSDKLRDPPKYLKLTTRPDDPTSDDPSEVSVRSSISATISNEWFAGEDACDRPCDLLVIAEGMPDYLSLKQLGLSVISPITVTFRRADQPKLLRLSKRAKMVVLIPDQERSGAGMAGAIDTATVLAQDGRDARIAILPHEALRRAAEERLAAWKANQAAAGTTPTEDERKAKKIGDWKVDANEFVRDNPSGDEVRALIATALPLAEYLVGEIAGECAGRDLDERLRPILGLIAKERVVLERERLLDLIRTRFKIRRPILDAMFQAAGGKDAGDDADSDTKSGLLVDIISSIRFVQATNSRVFAVFGTEAIPTDSPKFRARVAHLFCEKSGGALVSDTTISTAVLPILGGDVLHGVVPIRYAHDKYGSIIVDLGDRSRRVVLVTPGSCAILDRSPLAFFRPDGLRPLPTPVFPANDAACAAIFEEARKFLAVTRPQFAVDFIWMLGAMRPMEPPSSAEDDDDDLTEYVVLKIVGGEGSGKSGHAKTARAAVDPRRPDLVAMPKDLKDISIGAENTRVLAYDNLSWIDHEHSDGLCRVSTGDGNEIRALYTPRDQTVFRGSNPIVITSVTEVITEPDLLSRCLSLWLSVRQVRKTKRVLGAEFRSLHPKLFGALCYAVARALRDLDKTAVPDSVRMQDAAQWALAGASAAGISREEILGAFAQSVADADSTVGEEPMVLAICEVVAPGTTWEGRTIDLLFLLTAEAERRVPETGKPTRRLPEHWPTKARGLTAALRRLEPTLKRLGFSIRFPAGSDGGEDGKQRILRVERAPSGITTPLPPNGMAVEEHQGPDDADLDRRNGSSEVRQPNLAASDDPTVPTIEAVTPSPSHEDRAPPTSSTSPPPSSPLPLFKEERSSESSEPTELAGNKPNGFRRSVPTIAGYAGAGSSEPALVSPQTRESPSPTSARSPAVTSGAAISPAARDGEDAGPAPILDPTLPHGDQAVEIFGVRHSTGELRVRLPIGLDEHAPRPEATFMTTYRGDELDAYVDSITDDACMTRATVEQRRFDGRVISVVVGLRHPSSATAASGIQAEPVWGWAAHHSGGGTEWADRELEDVA